MLYTFNVLEAEMMTLMEKSNNILLRDGSTDRDHMYQ